MHRKTDSISPSVRSATVGALIPGLRATVMPRAFASATGMPSTPVPHWWISRNCGA